MIRAGGGIGRHAILRGWWGNSCEFKSRSAHHFDLCRKIVDFMFFFDCVIVLNAEVVKLVDALDSKSSRGDPVSVQVRPSAP